MSLLRQILCKFHDSSWLLCILHKKGHPTQAYPNLGNALAGKNKCEGHAWQIATDGTAWI